VAADELVQEVGPLRRARQHQFVAQVALHVLGERAGRVVAAGAVLLHRLHHDPVELPADRPPELGRLGAAALGDGGERLAEG
jgi:hypothetical protein